MSWDRAPVAAALVDLLTAATEGAVSVFAVPPPTVNPPALVVSRVETVRYAAAALSIDEITLPILAVGPLDGDDQVSTLVEVARQAVLGSPDLGLPGTVRAAWPIEQRNWRALAVGGVDVLVCELVLTVHM